MWRAFNMMKVSLSPVSFTSIPYFVSLDMAMMVCATAAISWLAVLFGSTEPYFYLLVLSWFDFEMSIWDPKQIQNENVANYKVV